MISSALAFLPARSMAIGRVVIYQAEYSCMYESVLDHTRYDIMIINGQSLFNATTSKDTVIQMLIHTGKILFKKSSIHPSNLV